MEESDGILDIGGGSSSRREQPRRKGIITQESRKPLDSGGWWGLKGKDKTST